MPTHKEKIRFAVVGAGRGKSFINTIRTLGNEWATVVAICDKNPAALGAFEGVPGIRLYQDFNEVLGDRNVDAVCIATPVPQHACQAIAAMEAGKHVLSEVTAAYTIEECWDLVHAVERSGFTYMMAENYCFMEPILQVQRMVEEGVFGELTFASGSYIHDCRELFFTTEEELTWRGELRRNLCANTYPTHSLGPVARWLGINREDILKTTATWHSRSRSTHHYVKRNYPAREEYLDLDQWVHPDTVNTLIRTDRGILIDIRVDWDSARPHQMTRYELQGTKASFCWPDGAGVPEPEPLIWIEGRSPGYSRGTVKAWEPLFKYRDEFQHPSWREHSEKGSSAGHGGGDFFALAEFINAIREQRTPLIDVYDAVTWSSITPLSQVSIALGNAPVSVPNFKTDCR